MLGFKREGLTVDVIREARFTNAADDEFCKSIVNVSPTDLKVICFVVIASEVVAIVVVVGAAVVVVVVVVVLVVVVVAAVVVAVVVFAALVAVVFKAGACVVEFDVIFLSVKKTNTVQYGENWEKVHYNSQTGSCRESLIIQTSRSVIE